MSYGAADTSTYILWDFVSKMMYLSRALEVRMALNNDFDQQASLQHFSSLVFHSTIVQTSSLALES